MTSENYKKKDRDRKRYAYWFNKCVSVGLIPHKHEDTEQELRDIYKLHMESLGKPLIPDGEKGENEPHESTQGTSVKEFYEIKKSYEKDIDKRWENELKETITKSPHSYKREAIESGISPLLFDVEGPTTKTYTIEGEEITNKKRNKKKTTWNF